MKYIIFLLFFSSPLFSQSLNIKATTAGLATFKTNRLSLDHSIGQCFTNLHVTSGGNISEGIHQGHYGNLTFIEDDQLIHIDIEIYPNPSSETIKIESSEFIDGEITIFSLAGEILQQTSYVNGEPIDIEHLISGQYYVVFQTDQFRGITSFIKI